MRIPLVRRVFGFSDELIGLAFDGRGEAQWLDRVFAQPDPYGFARDCELRRFERAEQLIVAAMGGKFRRAMEVGCAEGDFTLRLAPLCESLEATDLSQKALERAAERCRAHANISFRPANIRELPPSPERYDLIVLSGVLEYVRRPSSIRLIRDRLVASLRPEGLLLIGTTLLGRQDSFWTRMMLRGRWTNRAFMEPPQLETVAARTDRFGCDFEHVLLRKRHDAPGGQTGRRP